MELKYKIKQIQIEAGWAVAVFLLLVAAVLAGGCSAPPAPPGVDIVSALSQDMNFSCYARADRPINIRFPRDLGPHENFKTEWWYYTGNMTTQTGRQFGFQLTFFRQALACDKGSGVSGWRTRQLYFAHFAVTDTQNQTFYSARRMNRGAVGIAGGQSDPFKVWIDDWSAQGTQTIRLKASDRVSANGDQNLQNIGVDLRVDRVKPVILQGQEGWSKKGPGPSDASYYYSFPGMTALGRLTLGQETHDVRGHVWFDHEWSTSALGDDVSGWDWFAFHLSDGTYRGADIMVCQVRRADKKPNGFGFGSISFADGSYGVLTEDQFSIEVLGYWTSPRTQKKYPAQWRITLPGHGLVFEAAPVTLDQEHPHGFSYYEGAIGVGGKTGSGKGYVEMTGY